MLSELTTHREEIEELCRRYGVARLAVFGSAATDDFDPERSDVDLLVAFDPESGLSRFEAHFGLKEDLEALLGRAVDLVSPAALENPYFARSVERTRHELFAAIDDELVWAVATEQVHPLIRTLNRLLADGHS